MNTTPWSELDYFRASRAARQAFDKSNQQLQIDGVLEEVESSALPTGAAAAGSISSSAPPDGKQPVNTSPLRFTGRGALDSPAEDHGLAAARDDLVSLSSPSAGLFSSPTSTEGAAQDPQIERGTLQKGA